MQITTQSMEETLKFGRNLALQLTSDSVVSLNGTLGAGKSVLVRGVAGGLGIDPESVTSPTFTLWQTYQGQNTLHHLDAYRLNSIDDFYDLGGEELFEMPGIKLIEWGDRIQAALPDDHLRVELEVVDETVRQISIASFGNVAVPNFI